MIHNSKNESGPRKSTPKSSSKSSPKSTSKSTSKSSSKLKMSRTSVIKPTAVKRKSDRQVIGWREWVRLPDLHVGSIKAKVDTGARTSSLHAFDLVEYRKGSKEMVRFSIHPDQRNTHKTIRAVAQIVDHRNVRPSSGVVELRPVILTAIEILGELWEVELTLTCRDAMGFRMLLGRQGIRGRMVVDPGRSYLAGKPKQRKQS